MSGLTSLVDTMLASKLAERVDLVPLKAAVEIAGPEAVTSAEKVSNDTRLPSRAAMLRQLGPELSNTRSAGTPHDPHSSTSTKFSAVARAISTILGASPGVASAVRGSAPVWALPTPPVPQQLAAVLARTVATSGLFYESHLSQFASGARALGELVQEPQARLGPLGQANSELPNSRAAPLALTASASTSPSHPNAPAVPAAPALVISPFAGADAALPPTSTAAADFTDSIPVKDSTDAAGPTDSSQPGKPAPDAALQTSHRTIAASVAAAYGAGATEATTNSQPHAPPQRVAEADLDSSMQSFAPDAARTGSQVAAGIHPDAVVLVRQQLELLAQPVFRWSGEVWPGTKMDWELSEERKDQQNQQEAEPQAAERTWQTRLKLTLPTLGAIEVRLSLADAQLQAHLAAGDETSLAVLRNDGDDLRQRFAAAGLQLTGLQIAPLTPPEG